MTMRGINLLSVFATLMPISLFWCLNVLSNIDIYTLNDSVLIEVALVAVAVIAVALAVIAVAGVIATATTIVTAGVSVVVIATATAAATIGEVAAVGKITFALALVAALALAAAECKNLSFSPIFLRFLFSALASGMSAYIVLSSLTLFTLAVWATSFLPPLLVLILVFWILPSGVEKPLSKKNV